MSLEASLLMLAMLWSGEQSMSVSGPASSGVSSPRKDDETEQSAALLAAGDLLRDGKPADAIAKIDPVIAYFEAKYPAPAQRWFVARDSTESLAYLLLAAADADQSTNKAKVKGPVNAQVLMNSVWADAYYLKGYALVEQGRLVAASAEFERAIALMPYNSHYLAELAYSYKGAKNWSKMLEVALAAEDAAAFSPKEQKNAASGRAKRMAGYALVELDRLDEAAAKYEECLRLDANDELARRELDYVREQIKQRRS